MIAQSLGSKSASSLLGICVANAGNKWQPYRMVLLARIRLPSTADVSQDAEFRSRDKRGRSYHLAGWVAIILARLAGAHAKIVCS